MKTLVKIVDFLFFAWTRGCGLVRCSITGCKRQAMVFKKSLRFCAEHAREIGLVN